MIGGLPTLRKMSSSKYSIGSPMRPFRLELDVLVGAKGSITAAFLSRKPLIDYRNGRARSVNFYLGFN
jgi:hypothetical protein